MKLTIWDLLTGLIMVGILCLLGVFGAILLNPSIPLNPLKPLATVQPIFIPTNTTVPPTATVFGLPPTWTPTPRPGTVQVIDPAAPSVPGDTIGLPTLRPSRTPEPSATFVVLPTFTPSKTVRVGGPGGPGVGGGNCQVIYQEPADGDAKKRGDVWRTRWTIKNTSTTNWPRGNLDIKFMGGDRVHTSPDAEDMDYDVNAGGAVDIFVDMRILETDEKGTKTSNWALTEGTRTVCRFYVTFDVK